MPPQVVTLWPTCSPRLFVAMVLVSQAMVEVPGFEPGSRCLDAGSATSVGPGGLSGRRAPGPGAGRPYTTEVSLAAGGGNRQVEPGYDARSLTPGEWGRTGGLVRPPVRSCLRHL